MSTSVKNPFRASGSRWSITTATGLLLGAHLHLRGAGQWVAGTVIPRGALFAEMDYGFGHAIAFHELGAYTGPGIHHQIAIGAPFYNRNGPLGGANTTGAVWIGNMQFNGVNTTIASGVLDESLNVITPEYFSENPRDAVGFGMCLASGDFDGDGFRDLAISASPRSKVFVIQTGPRARLKITFPDVYCEAGSVMVVGDFNRDGVDDLVIAAPLGLPNNQTGSATLTTRGGSISVLPGLKNYGLGQTVTRIVQTDVAAASDPRRAPTFKDGFGYSLAVGNFLGDSCDDLAIGVPGEDSTNQKNTGLVYIVPGSSTGLQPAQARVLDPVNVPLPNGQQPLQSFGLTLAAGKFGSRVNPYDNLFVGLPNYTLEQNFRAGIIVRFQPQLDGLPGPASVIRPESLGLAPGQSLSMGLSLRVADLNGDGVNDLALTLPQMSLPTPGIIGALGMIAGKRVRACAFCGPALDIDDLDFTRIRLLKNGDSQNFPAPATPGALLAAHFIPVSVLEDSESSSAFGGVGAPYFMVPSGAALITEDINMDGTPDLVFGVPQADPHVPQTPAANIDDTGLISLLFSEDW